MKTYKKILYCTFALLFSLSACSTSSEMEIIVENYSGFYRLDEPVTILRADLEYTYGDIPEGMVPLLISEAGDTIPSQVDDLNGNGIWDELFFLCSINPESIVRYRVIIVEPHLVPSFVKRTNIRMAKIKGDQYHEVAKARRLAMHEIVDAGIYQFEGPGWENDLVGFRNYLDARNGMDIFGKTTSEMVLDRVGINEDYHSLQSWGMDILRVGTSLGAGSIALEKNGKLYRIGPEAKGYFKRVSEGPLRSVFRLVFEEWMIEGLEYALVHEISINAGAWYYESKVYLPGFNGEINLVAGIASIDLDIKEAVLTHFEDKYTTVMTHGKQAYDYENLGMAIFLEKNSFTKYKHVGEEGDDITNSFMVYMPLKNENSAWFRFYSCWEKSDSRFADRNYFHELIRQDASRLLKPLNLSIN